MKINSAVLVVAGAVAGHAVLGYLQHRQRVTLDLGLGHQRLIADGLEALREDARNLAGRELSKVREKYDDYRTNRVLAFISLKFRLGAMGRSELAVNVREMAEDSVQRAYWQRNERFRRQEALASGDRRLRAFVAEVGRTFAAERARRLEDLETCLAANVSSQFSAGLPRLRKTLQDPDDSWPGSREQIVNVRLTSADDCYQLDIEGLGVHPLVTKEDVAEDREEAVETAVREALKIPHAPLKINILSLTEGP
ncbi:hypothetical protein ACFY2K_11815 [Kitasatospora sp. NPDC001309]|uniref:hypothetical protein n=1 Tax=Kitasatospora sp. NPDC001309 TaxID=3364013 RepID=UPI00368F7190